MDGLKKMFPLKGELTKENIKGDIFNSKDCPGARTFLKALGSNVNLIKPEHRLWIGSNYTVIEVEGEYWRITTLENINFFLETKPQTITFKYKKTSKVS